MREEAFKTGLGMKTEREIPAIELVSGSVATVMNKVVPRKSQRPRRGRREEKVVFDARMELVKCVSLKVINIDLSRLI